MKLKVIEGGKKNPTNGENSFVETVRVKRPDGKRFHVQGVEVVVPAAAGGGVVVLFLVIRALLVS